MLPLTLTFEDYAATEKVEVNNNVLQFARSLCSQSDLIVADEPTGNLDENTAADIVRIFQDLAPEN